MNNGGIIINKDAINKFIFCDGKPLDAKFCEDNFNGWTYDLRLGREVYISSEDLPRKLKKQEPILIKSGDFALLITEEDIKLEEDVMAFINIRFTYKKKGLINVSGFHVDPTYKGKLIFSVYNAGPNDVVIRRGDPVFMIFFQRINGKIPYNKHRKDGYTQIPSSMISEIKGTSTSLANNAARLDKLEFYFKVTLSAVIALFSLLVGLLLKEGLR